MLNTRRFRIKEFLDQYYSLPPKERRRALRGLYKRVCWMMEEAWAHSDNATFRREYQRIAEGVRKAGLPER